MSNTRTLFLLSLSWALLQPLQAAPAQVGFAQSASTVEVFDFVEVALDVAQPDAANPFTDVTVTGEFARDGKRRGQLRVDPQYPEHFLWAGTGEHYFWNGTTTYYLMGWQDDAVIRQAIDRLAALTDKQLAWTTNTPPGGGPSALDFGRTPANRAVEFAADVLPGLEGLKSFTLSGWVNARSAQVGRGGNRIVTAINHGGDGFDLVMTGDGRLQLGVNQWPDGSPARSSARQIPADPEAPAANWRFYAVTYDTTKSPAEVRFYFGTPEREVALDATVAYDRGPVGEALGPLAVGHFNRLTRPDHTDRMFRGLMDEIRMHGSPLDGTGALTLEQIRARQGAVRKAATPAVSPAAPGAERPAPRPKELPKLRVSENRRFLVQADGRPFFWLGDTAWELFHRLNREEAEHYLADRAAKGFTVIQAVALAELNGLTEPNRYGHLPLRDKDPAHPAVADGPANDYWDFVDQVLDAAARRRLHVGFLPTWGSYVTSSAFDGKVNGVFNTTNALAYGRFLGERYRDRSHLIWILGGDKAPSTPEAVAVWRAMARGIAEGVSGREDYSKVLMTYHISGPGHVSDYLHEEPWLDFTSAQSSHGDLVESWRFIEKHWHRQPVKPVIDLESSYPGLLIPAAWLPAHMRAAHPSTQPANDDHARRAAYWAVFAGAFGHTYGHNSVWQMYEPPRPPILDAKLTWREALNAPSATQMGYLRQLMESRAFLTQAPDQSLIARDVGSGPDHLRALRGDGFALLYTPTGKPFRVRLNTLGGEQVNASWFDPRTGQARALGTFAREGERDFTPPGAPALGNDWVLVLEPTADKIKTP